MEAFEFVNKNCSPAILEELARVTGNQVFMDESRKERPFYTFEQEKRSENYYANRITFMNAIDVIRAKFERDYIKKLFDARKKPVKTVLIELEQTIHNCIKDALALINLNFQSLKAQYDAFESQTMPSEMSSVKRILQLGLDSIACSYFKERKLKSNDKSICLCAPHELGPVCSLVKSNSFDIGVGIAADGTFHASLFDLLGAKTINIGLCGGGSERTRSAERKYYQIDDLRQVNSKRALVIEHDFLTGKTLEKAYQMLKEHNPIELSLYLGAMSLQNASRPELAQAFSRIQQLYPKIYFGHDSASRYERSDEFHSAANMILRKYYAKPTAKAH